MQELLKLEEAAHVYLECSGRQGRHALCRKQ